MPSVMVCPIPDSHPAKKPFPVVIHVDNHGMPWRRVNNQYLRYSIKEAETLARLNARIQRFGGVP